MITRKCRCALNEKEYNYNSIILLLELAKNINADYKTFIKNFDKSFAINNEERSYVILKLSEFMMENGDYVNSRKMASLSLRYQNNNEYIFALKQNYEKTRWFFYNASKVLSTFQYQ